MNYMTTHYKNLSENLQAKVEILEKQLQQLTEDIANVPGSNNGLFDLRPFFPFGQGGFMESQPTAPTSTPVTSGKELPPALAKAPVEDVEAFSNNLHYLIGIMADPNHPIHKNPPAKQMIINILQGLPPSHGASKPAQEMDFD